MHVSIKSYNQMHHVLRILEDPQEVARLRARAFTAPGDLRNALERLLQPASGVSTHRSGHFEYSDPSSMLSFRFMTMQMAFASPLGMSREELQDPLTEIEIYFVALDRESFDIAEDLVRAEIDRLLTLHRLIKELPEADLEAALKKRHAEKTVLMQQA